jgi:glycosyltransferase 2 family protein
VKRGHVWVGMGVSLALVVYLFSRVDYGQLLRSLASADGPLLLVAAAMLAGTLVIRAWRWQYLLKPLKNVGFSDAMSATSIGMMANMILPLRLGEIVRAAVLGYQAGIDRSASFATVVVDRLLDGFTILLILAILLLTASLPLDQGWEEKLRWGGGLLFVFYLGVFALLFSLQRFPTQVLSRLRRLCSWLPTRWVENLCRFVESFGGGLHTLGRTEYLGRIVVTSLMLWGLTGLYNFLVVLAFGLNLPLTVGFLLLVTQAAAVMIPASPGFIGTHHAASFACLSLWGVGPETALSVALVIHAIGYFSSIAIGAIYLWVVGISLRDFSHPARVNPGVPSTNT